MRNILKIAAVLSLFITLTAAAQNSTNFIEVSANATIRVPADQIIFGINLTSEDKDPNTVFDVHKKLEKNLMEIFNQFNIPDSNITFSLLTIHNIRRNEKEGTVFQSNQNVMVKLIDIKQYEKFQIALLKNEIYNFNASFAINDPQKGEAEALKASTRKGREEAELIAKSMGREVGEAIEISSGNSGPSPRGMYFTAKAMDSESLVDIPQFVNISASLRIKFSLK